MLTKREQQLSGAAFFLALALALWGCAATTYPLSKTAAPAFTSQPASQTVAVGQPAVFSVTATGTAPLTYQWQKNSANISGATAASYTTPVTVSGDNGAAFRVVVTNSLAARRALAMLTVTASSVGPSVTTQPANQAVTRTGLRHFP